MESSKAQENRSFMSYKMDQGVDDDDDDDEEEEEDSEYGELGFAEDDSKKKKGMTSSSSSTKKGSGLGRSDRPFCQSDNCNADLTVAKNYHRRHKVCEIHAKAPIVLIAGYQKRFCQQCSRFHGLIEFDETKRSCRKRLAGHNERRRKNMSDINIHGEGSID